MAALASLSLSSLALAGEDPLKGGTVTLQLKKSRGLGFKPKNAVFNITRGDVDPITGGGTVEVTGRFKAKSRFKTKTRGKSKRRKNRAKVKILSITFGANGGPGTISAKVGKRRVERFATLRGGQTTRDGLGARITGINAKLTSKGLKALRKRSGKRKGKGASAAKSARLGTVSATTIPRTVEVVPGSGFLVTRADSSLLPKLAAHCIDATPPPAAAGGAFPIAPGVQESLPNPVFRYPVTGGSVAPDLNDGKITTAGGQGLRKNNGPLTAPYAMACASTPPAVGTTITNTEYEVQLNLKALGSFVTLPTGPVGVGSSQLYSGGTQTFDPATKRVTFSDVQLRFDPLAAFVIGQVFPNVSGDPANDFRGGDLLGTFEVTVTLR